MGCALRARCRRHTYDRDPPHERGPLAIGPSLFSKHEARHRTRRVAPIAARASAQSRRSRLISLRTMSTIPLDWAMSWGRNVKAALLLADASIDDAARELNLSRKTLERTMRGERTPRIWETARLAEVLDVPVWFLQDGLAGLRQRGPYATISDVAQYWNISPRSVQRLCERWQRGEAGGLPYMRIGGTNGAIRILWRDVHAYGQVSR